VLNAKLCLTLATASLSAAWFPKGNPAISEIRDIPTAVHSFYSMSGVMLIDDWLSDGRQFFGGGEFVNDSS